MNKRKLLLATGKWLTTLQVGGFLAAILAVLAVILPLIDRSSLEKYFDFHDAWQLTVYVFTWIVGMVLIFLATQGLGHIVISWGQNTRPKIRFVPVSIPMWN